MNKVKATSYKYGSKYQQQQVDKYKNRANNHWKYRFEIFNKLLTQKVMPLFSNRKKSDITLVDIGCSMGTFALEAGRQGYNSIGIDFDSQAIDIANQLAKEENVNVKFICGDISREVDFDQEIDIAVCFDIFEHLHDDEIGAFLQAIKNRLSKNGVILYHTFPTQYDYIFFEHKFVYLPLVPFSIFGKKIFEKIVKIYAAAIDMALVLFKGTTYKERIKADAHCNLLSKERLSDILQRAGFDNKLIEVSQLYKIQKKKQNIFKKHPISCRNLYGVAIPIKK